VADAYKSFSDSYGAAVTVTSTGDGVAFGFTATRVRVANDGPVRVFYDLGTTGEASTSDPTLGPGEDVVLQVLAAGAGFKTTSTSTGDAQQPQVRVSAFRS
jgi:hypothetical protein